MIYKEFWGKQAKIYVSVQNEVKSRLEIVPASCFWDDEEKNGKSKSLKNGPTFCYYDFHKCFLWWDSIKSLTYIWKKMLC